MDYVLDRDVLDERLALQLNVFQSLDKTRSDHFLVRLANSSGHLSKSNLERHRCFRWLLLHCVELCDINRFV